MKRSQSLGRTCSQIACNAFVNHVSLPNDRRPNKSNLRKRWFISTHCLEDLIHHHGKRDNWHNLIPHRRGPMADYSSVEDKKQKAQEVRIVGSKIVL